MSVLITTLAGVTVDNDDDDAALGGALPDTIDRVNVFLGTSLAASPNLGTAGNLTNKGSGPTWFSNYARLSPTNALITPVALGTNAHTLGVAFRRRTGGTGASARIISTSPGSTILLTVTDDGLLTLSGAQGADPATLQLDGDLDAWRVVFARVGGDEDTRIWCATDDTESADGGPGQVSGNASNYIEICGGLSGTNTKEVDVAWMSEAGSIRSDVELLAQYKWVKGLLRNAKGITA